jgi:hypothetical protein
MFAQGGYERGRIGYGTADDLSNGFTAAFRKGDSAISGKTVDIEHRASPDHQLVGHGMPLTVTSAQGASAVKADRSMMSPTQMLGWSRSATFQPDRSRESICHENARPRVFNTIHPTQPFVGDPTNDWSQPTADGPEIKKTRQVDDHSATGLSAAMSGGLVCDFPDTVDPEQIVEVDKAARLIRGEVKTQLHRGSISHLDHRNEPAHHTATRRGGPIFKGFRYEVLMTDAFVVDVKNCLCRRRKKSMHPRRKLL